MLTEFDETKDDESVTIRYRDTMQQERVKISTLKERIAKEVSIKNIFDAL